MLKNLGSLFRESAIVKKLSLPRLSQKVVVPEDSHNKAGFPQAILASLRLPQRQADSATSMPAVQRQGGPGSGPSGHGGGSFGKIIQKPEQSKPASFGKIIHKPSTPQNPKPPQGLSHALTSHMKASNPKESFSLRVLSHRFMESEGTSSASRYKVVLLCEGLGNLRDGFFYTKDAIESGAPKFEGQHCYANHPSTLEEQTRPERDVRDIIGHFENCAPVQNGDHMEIQGDLVVMDGPAFDWVKSQLDHALEFSKKYPDKSFIGLSINAAGDASPIPLTQFLKSYKVPASCMPKVEEAQSQGLTTIRACNQITEAISCDLVTQAGAGGKVLQAM